MEFGDLTTLITVGIAVFIFLRLRSVLGKRTGHQNPPVDRNKNNGPQSNQNEASNDNVITLPNRGKANKNNDNNEASAPDDYVLIDAIAKKRTKLNKELRELKDVDADFKPASFIDGSKLAYEMIVTAFADGDKKTLKNLLSREVYEGFASAIKQREEDGLSVRSSFVGVGDAKITAAETTSKEAMITVKFVSQIVSATFDKDENLIDGNSEEIGEVTDIWTFSRNLRSRDPNWKLSATQ